MSGAEAVAARCSCGIHAVVHGEVPDPDCVMHGEQGIQAWSTCQTCGRRYRHVVGHTHPIPQPKDRTGASE